MSATTDFFVTPAARAASLLRHVVEGRRRWGLLRISASDRWGWQQLRLSVFPPGTNSQERRALAFFRNWPLVGALMAVAIMMTLGVIVTPAFAAVLASIVYGAGVVVGFLGTRRVRPRVRHVGAVVIRGERGVEQFGDAAFITETAAALTAMDDAFERGELSPVDYEREWTDIYESILTEETARATRRRAGAGRSRASARDPWWY